MTITPDEWRQNSSTHTSITYSYVFSDQLLDFWYLVHCHNCRYSTNVGNWILRRRCKHFFFLPPFLANMPIISFLNVFQTYLLACCPDTWSAEMLDRMYVYGLIVVFWLFPLTIITICYQKVRYIHNTSWNFVLQRLIHNATFQIFVYTRGTRADVNNHLKRTESKEETVANETSKDNTSVNSIKTISKRDSVLTYLHSEIFVVRSVLRIL